MVGWRIVRGTEAFKLILCKTVFMSHMIFFSSTFFCVCYIYAGCCCGDRTASVCSPALASKNEKMIWRASFCTEKIPEFNVSKLVLGKKEMVCNLHGNGWGGFFFFFLSFWSNKTEGEACTPAMSHKCLSNDLFPQDSHNVTILSNPFTLIKEQFQQIH